MREGRDGFADGEVVIFGRAGGGGGTVANAIVVFYINQLHVVVWRLALLTWRGAALFHNLCRLARLGIHFRAISLVGVALKSFELISCSGAR